MTEKDTRTTPARVVSVIVHHRGREMLGVAVETLLDSRGVDLHVVVVLNGCDEDLPEIVEDERVTVVETPEATGFSEANNFGVRKAKAILEVPDYWYFVNNDTRHTPQAVALQVAALRAESKAVIAGPRLMIQSAPEHLNSLGINVTEDGWGWDEGIGQSLNEYGDLPGTREVLAVTGSAMMAKSAAFEAIGGWTEIYGYYFEDIDLCLKARKKGWTVLNVPESVVEHQISATAGVASDRKWYLFRRNRLVLVLAHWPLAEAVKVVRLIRRQIAEPERDDRELLERSLAEVRQHWDEILECRREFAGDDSWTRFLKPVGSVPVIRLPGSGEGEPAVLTVSLAVQLGRVVPHRGRKRVLVVGFSPLPFEDERMNYAPGGRTWQLARPLAEEGHGVLVLACRIPGAYHDETPGVRSLTRDGVTVVTLDLEAFEAGDVARELMRRFAPDVFVGTSTVPAHQALDWVGERPYWVDVFGDPMAEAQARSGTFESGDQVTAYLEAFLPLLRRGDRFSAVSQRQAYALLGQLGLAGRLGRETLEHGLIDVIPVGCLIAEKSTVDTTGSGSFGLEPDDLVILWSGGFNTWCDVATLASGLAAVCFEEPRAKLVVTGGSIRGHDETTFAEFERLVAESGLEERVEFLGRLRTSELNELVTRADLCLVTEMSSPERILGSSGRVVQWMGAGKPLVCTAISELGVLVGDLGLGWTYRPGASADLARVLLEALRNPGERARRAAAARRHASRFWTGGASCPGLITWVDEAARIPESSTAAGGVALRSEVLDLQQDLEESRRQLAGSRRREAVSATRAQELGKALGDIHHSKIWKLWTGYHRLRRLGRAEP